MTQPGPWNAVAAAYDEEFFTRTPELIAHALQLVAPGSGARVLDVGTGPGALAIAMARRVGQVVAIDFAENMIERLRGHLATAGVTNVEAHVMDGQALDLPDASFDVVTSMFGWFLFADRAAGLAEFHRVLRPGGRVLVTSWSAGDRNTMFAAGMAALREVLPDLPRPAGPLPTQQPEVCAGELRAAGFQDVAVDVLDVPAPIDSVEEYWRTFERAAAPVVLLRERLGPGWNAVRQAVLQSLERRFSDGPRHLQVSAIYARGRR